MNWMHVEEYAEEGRRAVRRPAHRCSCAIEPIVDCILSERCRPSMRRNRRVPGPFPSQPGITRYSAPFPRHDLAEIDTYLK